LFALHNKQCLFFHVSTWSVASTDSAFVTLMSRVQLYSTLDCNVTKTTVFGQFMCLWFPE